MRGAVLAEGLDLVLAEVARFADFLRVRREADRELGWRRGCSQFRARPTAGIRQASALCSGSSSEGSSPLADPQEDAEFLLQLLRAARMVPSGSSISP